LRRLGFLGRFHFKIDYGAAGFGGFKENFEFGGQVAGEVPAKLFAAASGNRRQVAVGGQELLQPRQHCCGLGERVQPELDEFGFFSHGRRPLPQFPQANRPGWLRRACPAGAWEPPPGGQMQPCWNQCET